MIIFISNGQGSWIYGKGVVTCTRSISIGVEKKLKIAAFAKSDPPLAAGCAITPKFNSLKRSL